MMNRELLALAAEMSRRRQPFVTATVVWARGPSSGKRGSTAIIEPDGTVHGWIGGACAEPVVIREARESLQDGRSRLLFLGTEEDIAGSDRPDVTTVPISCTSEGALEVFLDPMLPQPYLVVVGRSPAVRTLTKLAVAMDWRVTVVDDGGATDDHPEANAVLTTMVLPPDVDEGTAVVVATQGHYDEPALEAALQTEAGYVGLVASRARAETVLGYLRDRGLGTEAIDRVTAPAGIDLGHVEHREIGVAIMAELAALKAKESLGGSVASPASPHTAVDPICHMEVDVATARFISEHDGETYYFCSAGCKASFDMEPAVYATIG